MKNRGVSLIEILVVIAIIGLLASAVSAVSVILNTDSTSTRDNDTIQAATQLIAEAHLYKIEHGNFVGLRMYWVGRNRTYEGTGGDFETCEDRRVGNISPYGDKFLSLCKSIEENLPNINGYYQYWGYRERNSNTGDWIRNGAGFAIIVHLRNGDWFCANSNGVRKQGTYTTAVTDCRDVTL